MLNQVREQQRAGGTQRKVVRLLLPVVVQQKLAIDSGNFVIAGKGFYLQRERSRTTVPNLLAYPAEMFIGSVKVDKREVAANIPCALIAFGHQAETVGPAAVFPAMWRSSSGSFRSHRQYTGSECGDRFVPLWYRDCYTTPPAESRS